MQRGDVGMIVGRDLFEVVDGCDHLAGDGVPLRCHPQQDFQQLDDRAAVRIAARLFDFRQAGRVAGEAALHGGDDIGAPFRAVEAFRQRTQIGQPLEAGRCLDGDVADRIVFQNAAARNVTALCLLLAPCRDFHQDRELPGLADPRLQPLPGAFGMKVVGLRRGQNLHLLADPIAAAALLQVGVECREHVAQMGDVGDRVMHLFRAQRPARPVGKAVRLVRPMAHDALDQLVIGNGIAVAEYHGRHLGVEDRVRDDGGLMPDDFDILAGGMKNLQHRLIRHQFEKRLEVDPLGQGVDHHRFLGARHLHDAEQGVIRGLAQELRIDCYDRVFREAGTDGGEFRGGGNQMHEGSITLP